MSEQNKGFVREDLKMLQSTHHRVRKMDVEHDIESETIRIVLLEFKSYPSNLSTTPLANPGEEINAELVRGISEST